MINKIINNIKTKYRKHDFDLKNPEKIITNIIIEDKSFQYYQYKCKNCGQTLALDLWQMKTLPLEMARGCPGR